MCREAVYALNGELRAQSVPVPMRYTIYYYAIINTWQNQ